MSTFPTSANDSESINQGKSPKLSSVSAVYAIKPSAAPHPSLFEITFDHSSNPLRIDEDFSTNNDKSELDSSSSSSSSDNINNPLDANNNTKSKKSSQSSSSPLFDHSSDSSFLSNELNEKSLPNKELTESDDGIIFLHDDKRSSSSSPIPSQTKSLTEKRMSISNEKDIPRIYFYFVMELCQPESLRDRLIQRSIDRHQAWAIFDQIVKGIEYIHSQKLVKYLRFLFGSN
jgi:hypothetical protein